MPDTEAPPIGSVAWLEAALRDRLGPDAVLGDLTFAGRLFQLTGTRIPLGNAALLIDHAAIELGKGAPLDPLPLSARLASLRAAITIADRRIDLTLTGDDTDARAFFSGEGTLAAGKLTAAITASITRDDDTHLLRTNLRVEHEGTRLTLDLALDPRGTIHASHLGGRLDLAALGVLFPLPRDLAVGPGSTLDLDLDLGGSLPDPHATGRVYAAPLILTRRADHAVRVDDLTALLDLDLRRLRYRELRASTHGARVAGWGRIPFGSPPAAAASVPLAALAVEHAGVGLLAAVASLFGIPVHAARAPSATLGINLPADLAIDGELMIRPDRALSGAVAITTPRTDLRLQLALTETGDLVGSTLRGRLDAGDAATLGLFPGPVRPRPPAIADIDARLGGTLTSPALSGRLQGESLVLDISPDPTHPAVALADVSVLLDADRTRLAWHRLTGRFCGGTFVSSGRVAFGNAAGMHAVVGFTGVRVEQIPTAASGPSRLATVLHGAASGELRLDRHGFGDAPLFARGEITITDPRYLITRDLAEPLARFGLPRLRTTGRGPLTARVRVEHEELFIDTLRAALDGVDLAADVRLARDGRLDGRAVVELLASYLAGSPILAVPAAIAGRVTIPVDLAGTVQAPEIRTDALAILEGMIAENRVGDALKTMFDGWRGTTRTRRRTKR